MEDRRERRTRATAAASGQLAALLALTGEGVLIARGDDRLVESNDAARQLLGMSGPDSDLTLEAILIAPARAMRETTHYMRATS